MGLSCYPAVMTCSLRLLLVVGGLALGLGASAWCKPSPSGNPTRVKPGPSQTRPSVPPKTPLRPPQRLQPPQRPQRPLPPVAVELGPTTLTWSGNTLFVSCPVTLINRTGRTLYAVTSCGSVFDGFTVEVRHPHGALVARVSYVAHKSPYAANQRLPVAPGETQVTLRFPITLKTQPTGPLEVQLVGGILGTRWSRSLHSNIVQARWSKGP
jgi:hypothetical protein